MRVALVVSGLSPYARSGVEGHSAALAAALAAEGAQVEVCATRPLPGLMPLAQRREERDGWAVTWVNVDPAGPPDEAGRTDAFAAFLDRERPDVVHFEDVAGLGLEAVAEVEGRGLPAVFTAHDWFAVSDQSRLLAPDGRAFAPDGHELEARMALGRHWLHEEGALEAAADMVLPGELGVDSDARLVGLVREGQDDPELEDVRARVRARAQVKKAAFSAFNARFAATKHLARRLSATLGRAVDWRAPGIDPTPFAGSRVRRREGPMRFGYLGPLGRAGGAHLLLEAFAQLEPGQATLVLHGDTEERQHLGRLRARADELGVTWGGPYRAEDTAALLADLDVRVLPALWEGGLTLDVLEAWAACRPVIAPRIEGLGDLVREQVDGVLFESGDTSDLRAGLEYFCSGEFKLDQFELELREPRTVRAEAREWLSTYQEVVDEYARRRPQPDLPADVASFAARYEAFVGLPTRDLLGQVLAGLEVLSGQMGLTASPRELLLVAAGRGSSLRDSAAADRRVIERLQRSVQRIGGARAELEEHASWHAAQLAQLSSRLEEREAALTLLDAEVGEARRARDEVAAAKAEDAEERVRLETELGQRLAAAKALEGDLMTTREAHSYLDLERAHLELTLSESAHELCFLRERVAGEEEDEVLTDHGAIEQHFETLEKELGGLKEHESWLRREVGTLFDDLARSIARPGAQPPRPMGADTRRDGLQRLGQELVWRREEMTAARAASQRQFARLVGSEPVGRTGGLEGDTP